MHWSKINRVITLVLSLISLTGLSQSVHPLVNEQVDLSSDIKDHSNDWKQNIFLINQE